MDQRNNLVECYRMCLGGAEMSVIWPDMVPEVYTSLLIL
jgi:hypothetical protein